MGWLIGRKNKFEAFWEWFGKNEQVYYELAEVKQEKAMNELYKRLQKVNKHLAYEFSYELLEGKREFVISADGMVEAFDDVLDLVDAAPELEGFVVIPFRQPNEEEFAVTYGAVEVSQDDLYYTAEDNGDFDLTIYAKGLSADNEDEYIPAIFILLDSLIGEFYVGTRIGELDFKPYEKGLEAAPIYELKGLMGGMAEEDLDLDFLPPTLKKLKQLDDLLQEEGKLLEDGIGLRWTDRRMAYSLTPLDVIPFMDAGLDGIHVGLLTEFGGVTDLEQAFIVCVNPTDPEYAVKLLARNAKEFVDYLYSDRDLLMLFNHRMTDSKEKFQQSVKEAAKDYAEHPELGEARNHILPKLQAYMGCEQIDDIYGYVEHTVAAERKKVIALRTLDSLGIVGDAAENYPAFPMGVEEGINLSEARAFFESAPRESKLAFIRDVQFTGLVTEDAQLKGFVMEELEKLGCSEEAERLRNMIY